MQKKAIVYRTTNYYRRVSDLFVMEWLLYILIYKEKDNSDVGNVQYRQPSFIYLQKRREWKRYKKPSPYTVENMHGEGYINRNS